ncbi:hypothetical protein CALCODRAFT_497489 [Calocera cornea HHB12733]|uniref:Uncharacterized protein n=1 Tax=Calocera cornea HHB12733 TaxID=1353952 RepID=A0A165F7A4_9BASI|nr:hypothetical protein CALCODRAFT_497489 [Calocera cornea HHB12733]
MSLIRSTVSAQAGKMYRLPECSAATLVAIAGVLLEYSVIYVPSPDMYLLNVDVLVCSVILEGDDEHVLLQFSYPAVLTEKSPFDTAAQDAILTDRYTSRLQKTRSEWSSVRVEFTGRQESRLCL